MLVKINVINGSNTRQCVETKGLKFIKEEGVCDELKVLEEGSTRPVFDAV